jgi:DNA polymerase-3 subunit beta
MQESRPLLTGVNIKLQGSLLECTATDSYRLSKVSTTLDKVYDENINIVIPSRNINELVKVLDNEEDVEIHVFANKIIFRTSNIIFQSSLLNGNYPNTDNSIAKDFKYIIKTDLKEFYNTLDRASLLTQSKDKNIIDVEIDGNNLLIKASSLEMGKVEEKLLVDNQTNNKIRISFSAKYMLDALKMFSKDNIFILLNGEISPIILKEEENEELIELILPMKTY